MTLDSGSRAQIIQAYREMAARAKYRPAAPSDGFGHITVPVDELDLDAEGAAYADAWWQQENDGEFILGCANYDERVAMIYAVEAARLCCSGFGSRPYIRKLLQMAARELADGGDR